MTQLTNYQRSIIYFKAKMNSRDEDSRLENNAKLFITNLPPDYPEQQVKGELQSMFDMYGPIVHLNVKKNKNGQYSFAFLQFERVEDAKRAIQEMDQKELHQRPMKVRQDRQMEGCFHCKKTGHFAKQCPYRDGLERPRDIYEERRCQQKSRERRDYLNRERERDKERDREFRYPREDPDRDYKKRNMSRSRSYSIQRRRHRYSRQSESPRDGYRRRSSHRKDRDYDHQRGRDYDYDYERERRKKGSKYGRDSRSRSRSYGHERERRRDRDRDRDRDHYRRRDSHYDDYSRGRRNQRSYSRDRSYSKDSRNSRH